MLKEASTSIEGSYDFIRNPAIPKLMYVCNILLRCKRISVLSCTVFMPPPPRSGEGHIVLPLPVCLYVRTSHFVVLIVSPQLLQQYLMQGFEPCNTVQTFIEYVLKGNVIFLSKSLLQNGAPFNDLDIFAQYVA